MPRLRPLLEELEDKNPSKVGKTYDRHVLKVVEVQLFQHVGVEVRGRKMHGNVKKKEEGDELACSVPFNLLIKSRKRTLSSDPGGRS